MKKFLIILLAAVMCVGFTACGSAEKAETTEDSAETTAAETTTAETTTAEETTTEAETEKSITTEEATDFITSGYFYMVSSQSPSVYEWKFDTDGTCSQLYRLTSEYGSSNYEPEYYTYSVEGGVVSVNEEYGTYNWYVDLEENCCLSNNIPWEPKTKYPRFEEQLSQEGVDSLFSNGIERIDANEPVADINKDNIQTLSFGDTIIFGSFEQDFDTSNGNEDIEWIVLEKNGNSLFVISKVPVGYELYNSTDTAVTWETCTLRGWLNDSFFNNAFTSEEQAKIQTTNVTADKNPVYDTDPGNDTEDKIFLLSVAEVEKYFADSDMNCAGDGGGPVATTAGGLYACRWWLRTPGIDQQHAAFIFNGEGDYIYEGHNVASNFEMGIADDGGCAGVRPAMWINLGL